MKIEQAAEEVLREVEPCPMHYTEITKRIRAKGLWQPRRNDTPDYNPAKSVNERLNTKIRDDPENCLWERVGDRTGKFRLKGAERVNTTRGGDHDNSGASQNRPQTNYYPDERHVREGARKPVTVNRYERNPRLRSECIQAHGPKCCICGFSFRETYGEVVYEDFIHVHHIRPLSAVGKEHPIDPVKDLRPVCPNCHAVIHSRKRRPFCVEEVQAFLQREKSG